MSQSTVNHENRTHAILSASRIQRALLCAGSVLAEEAMPEGPSSQAALQGTQVHELAELLLLGKPVPQDAPAELLRKAQTYVQAVYDFTPRAKKRHVELSVSAALQGIHPALGGTADLVAVGGGALTVCDLKTGRVDVDPEWNPQLMTYALGAALTLNAPDTVSVRLAIYQEDSGGWKEWSCSYADLLDWRDTLSELAARALAPNAIRSPSAQACKYCRARTVCPSLRERVVDAARQDFAQNVEVTTEMMDEAELCATWAEAVKDAARVQMINKPGSIAGWRLRDGRKMVTWKDEAKAAVALAAHKDAWTLKSPSSVQKLGLDLPPGLIEEKRTAASLVRAK